VKVGRFLAARLHRGCIRDLNEGAPVPTISSFFGILIRMYFNDHAPPHFHAHYNDNVAVIAIDSLQVLEGSLPPRALGLVIEWAQLHKAELIDDWELCRAKRQPLKIAPLE
jgi:hypothetical protein